MGQDEQQKLDRLQIPDVGDQIDGRYRVQGVIATGGMGVILRAEQLAMQRPVAIKLLHPHIAASDPNIVGRFEREVRLAKQLNHPNTIRLYDFGESERGLVYVAMELLEGMDLKRLISCEGPLYAKRALEICRQMLDGLAEAHAHDFIHRDLKPSNVFVLENRRGEDLIKVLDFGIAKSLTDAADLTGSGSICGTPSYVAPEYLMQERPGKPADIYAVGLILLEMLTGRQVFKGEAPVQTMMMHLKLDPEIPPEIEQTPLAAMIRKATAKEPAERFQDAEEMYLAVCEVTRHVPDDLVIKRPDPGALPDLTDEIESEWDTAERKRAQVDTIIPGAHDSDLDLPQAQSTPSWVERAVSSDVFRRELSRQQREDQQRQDQQRQGQPRQDQPRQDLTNGAQPARTRFPVTLISAVVVVVSVLVIGLFRTIDPGRAPEFEDGAPRAPTRDELVSPDPVEREPAVEVVEQDARREEPAPIGFDLDTDPRGAAVMVGERRLGQTPLVHRVMADELPQTVRFEKEGYEPREVELTRTSSPIVVEVLEQRERRARRSAANDIDDATRKKRSPRRRQTKRDEGDPSDESAGGLSNERIEQVMDQYLLE